ncbi:MAG: GTP 3',8-cyclase MoaA [Actinobacteria bacterium]|nr:MAG: GTP 3',8-cyclase MoaA [Actinomycetota bacterium]
MRKYRLAVVSVLAQSHRPEAGNGNDSLGRPLRDLRISVTDRCNFRCVYCMPKEVFGRDFQFLARTELLTFEEIARLSRVFVALGVEKLRITGGEPLVRRDLERLVALLAGIEGVREIAMTTNGSLLAAQAQALKEAGLGRVTVSLDSLDDDVFQAMNDVGFSVARVLEGIEAAAAVGLRPVKVNMVVKRGVNEGSVLPMARYFRGRGHILRFIEYMDVGTTNGWRLDEVVPAAEIGVIASVTQPFCRDCTRARLSADGELYTCLFASHGHDLRGPLRAGATDEQIAGQLRSIWSGRHDRYSELRSGATPQRAKVEMSHIGG